MNKRYQVFISSTYADLKDERSKVIQTIMELDCIPAGMELFPAIDNEQFDFIKKIIDDCDYYILIISGRYGSLSEDGLSFTEKEYDYANEKGIKILAFLHENPDDIPFGKSESAESLRKKLVNFRIKVSSNRLVKFWNKAEELPGLVALSLSKTIKTYPATGWIRSDTTTNPEVYQELNEIRKYNSELQEIISKKNSVKKIENNDLADIKDKYIFSGTYKWLNKRIAGYAGLTYSSENWEIEMTWERLFELISPYLIDYPADSTAKQIFSTTIYNLIKKEGEGGTATIDDQIFQTIKIHFSALGLINVKYTKTMQGGMGLFWSLTELGEKYMTDLRSIKKQL